MIGLRDTALSVGVTHLLIERPRLRFGGLGRDGRFDFASVLSNVLADHIDGLL